MKIKMRHRWKIKGQFAGCPLCLTGVRENVPLSLSRCEKVPFTLKTLFFFAQTQVREHQMVEFGTYSDEGKLRPIGEINFHDYFVNWHPTFIIRFSWVEGAAGLGEGGADGGGQEGGGQSPRADHQAGDHQTHRETPELRNICRWWHMAEVDSNI